MQIRETATGTYPPVVYQPLRSPKSPYAKFGPGSSCTLPAKLGARLLMDQIVVDTGAKLNQARCGDGVVQSGVVGVDETDSIEPQLQFDANSTLLPRFLHSTTDPKSLSQSPPASHSDHLIDLNDNTEPSRHLHHSHHFNSHHPHHHNHLHHHHHCQHHHHSNHSHHPPNDIVTIDETEHPVKHDHPSVDRDIRGSSEENSNASSDHTNGGYFSEDSSQSITDLYGSSMELKVQIRQCSDEKILKKNLSQDNLLKADYISRPNKKCEYSPRASL